MIYKMAVVKVMRMKVVKRMIVTRMEKKKRTYVLCIWAQHVLWFCMRWM